MREEKADVPELRQPAVEQQAQHGARGVLRVLDQRGRHARHEAAAAIRRERMEIRHGLAAIELLEDRDEERVAGPGISVAGHEPDAVGLEHVERVFDLAQRALDIGHGHRGEEAEAALVVAPHLRRIVVAQPRQAARLLLLAEPDARRRDRQHRGGGAGAVHLRHGAGDAPFPLRRLQPAEAVVTPPLGERLEVLRRKEMVVDVDARGVRRLRRGDARQHRASAQRRQPGQHLAARGQASGRRIVIARHVSPPRCRSSNAKTLAPADRRVLQKIAAAILTGAARARGRGEGAPPAPRRRSPCPARGDAASGS